MTSTEEANFNVEFENEWSDLQALRQLAKASSERFFQPLGVKKNANNIEEAESIKKAGNVQFIVIY